MHCNQCKQCIAMVLFQIKKFCIGIVFDCLSSGKIRSLLPYQPVYSQEMSDKIDVVETKYRNLCDKIKLVLCLQQQEKSQVFLAKTVFLFLLWGMQHDSNGKYTRTSIKEAPYVAAGPSP